MEAFFVVWFSVLSIVGVFGIGLEVLSMLLNLNVGK